MTMEVYLWFLCLCVTFCVGQECSNKKLDDEITIQSSTSCSIEFQITPGYQMEAEIEKLELDSTDQTYLLIKPDHDEKDYKFVWTLKEPQKFIIDQAKVFLKFETSNLNSQFRVYLKRHGQLTTTTEATTIVTWPTPVENDTIYHTVNLSVTPVEFKQQELVFKQVLVNMTEVYCEEQAIRLSENVTIKNVGIQLAVQCSRTWPDSFKCTQVRYAIPVFLLDSKKYELTSQHLEQMWHQMVVGYLRDFLDWDEYEVPDNTYNTLLWLGISVGVLAVFLVVLYCARAFSMRFGGRIKRRASDTEQIMATPKRVSDASLWPMASQVIPPLFASDTAYVFYEPDSTIKTTAGPMHHQQQHQHQHQINTTHMLDVDDSSDEEILTVNGNSARTSFNQNVVHIDHDAHNKESAL